MPVKKKDTDRALALMEDYCKKLKKPEEQQLKRAIKKVMGIFKSSLFQALLGQFSWLIAVMITNIRIQIWQKKKMKKEEDKDEDEKDYSLA